MVKKFVIILIVLITVLMIGASAYIAYGQGNPQPKPPPAPSMPLPLESIPFEKRAVEYYFVDKEQVLGLGMQLPRALTSQENEAIIQIGLSIEPVSPKISQGYNTELGWMAYYKNSGWGGFGSQIPKAAEVTQDAAYFPGVRVGIGRPQQEAIDIAVDLTTQKAIYSIRRPDKRVSAPAYVNYLSEEQKVKITSIALGTRAVQKYIQGEHQVDYQFVAVNPSREIAFSMDYDIVAKGIPEYLDKDITDKPMKIYPAVFFKSDSWMVSIAVDLETDNVMYIWINPTRQEPSKQGN
jgi:hypothetical protein